MLLALILPTSGVLRGLDAIRRCAVIGGSPLQKALKAGALCELVRTKDWKPQPGPGHVVQRIQPDSLELLHLPQKLRILDVSERQTPLPRVAVSPKIRIVGLDRRESFKPSYKMLDLSGRKLHGSCCLPPGYELAIIHPHSTILELNDDTEASSSVESDISWSYSFAKGLVAIFQSLYTCATLYESHGDQIVRDMQHSVSQLHLT